MTPQGDNIDDKELDDLKKLAEKFLNYTEEQIARAVTETELKEVMCDDQDKEQGGQIPQPLVGSDP
jgi:hypothetical protein